VGKKHAKGHACDQAGVLPFRYRRGRLEFCLITSTSKRRWLFPKGEIDRGETPKEAALKEAAEEAGLQGDICGKPLGVYRYSKLGRPRKVLVMLMKVRKASSSWEEVEQRQRQWVASRKAMELVDRPPLRRLVREAIKRLNNGAA